MENKELTTNGLNEMSGEERKQIYDDFIKQYAKSITSTLKRINANNVYNPMLGKEILKSISSSSKMPTSTDIESWLKDPRKYASQLRGVDKYFNESVMQYKRTTNHLEKILTFRYDMRLTTDFEEDEADDVIKATKKVWNYLRDFGVPYHSAMVMNRVVHNGGGFFYYQDANDYKTLIEMPIDYCYITGRWDRGYTFAIDLNWFADKSYLKETVPEIYAYYETFLEMKKLNLNRKSLADYQYYPVPVEKGFVFTFDNNSVDMIPPLTPVFKDATAIMTYKNLLMQRTALDTWKVIAQQIPLDKNDTPIFSGEQAEMFIDFIQSVLPDGTAVFATPMETKEVDFSSGASSKDNIVGRGEELFWRSAGVNGGLMDASDKSSATMKYSLINDEGFVDTVYQQFADFINLQLRVVSRKYRFLVKFYGNRYTEKDDAKEYKEFVVGANGTLGKLYALWGYEPFEVLPTMKLENALKYKELSLPIISGSQMSGKQDGSGAPEKSDSQIGDAGMQTRDNDSNMKRGE